MLMTTTAARLESDHASHIQSIDGLRAVAVFLVVMFHAGAPHLGGGYVGVDVFFVISGFVITRNITPSLARGRFSYLSFISGRFTRLAPALLCVITATLIAGIFVLSPRQIEGLAKEAASALLAASNIYFYLNSGYFDGDAASKPLLHTWSLGVEEQFYLLWPLLLLVTFRSKLSAIATISVLSAVSCFATILLADSATNATLYLMPFRVYQLGIGAIIALTGLSIRNAAGSIIATTAFVCIIASAVLVGPTTSVALSGIVSATATAALISTARSAAAERCLGNRFVTAVGRRAYSIYLVHWPIVVLTRGEMRVLDPSATMAILVFASFALGFILYAIVETPVRTLARASSFQKQRLAISATAAFLILALSASVTLISVRGVVFQRDRDLTKLVDKMYSERGVIGNAADYGRCIMATNETTFDMDSCLARPRGEIGLLGDSYGIDTIVALRDRFSPKLAFAHASLPGCPPIIHQSKRFNMPPKCLDFNAKRFRLIEANGFKSVILASMWRDEFAPEVADTVKYLTAKNIRVYVVGVRNAFDKNPVDILFVGGSVEKANELAQSHLVPHLEDQNRSFAAIVQNAGGTYIDVLPSQCTPGCRATELDGTLLYSDQSHLSRAGMDVLGSAIYAGTRGDF
ncbi:acyltransferase family protein [Tardiphaga sp. 215_C5_N2_1]|uniref:acyltransferase family protein n=1 Tax=Tardiphaga sp. 215_C5_N2_1 TaxID=3240774 RepID=UPI003F8B8864